jgi:hypothetical protein
VYALQPGGVAATASIHDVQQRALAASWNPAFDAKNSATYSGVPTLSRFASIARLCEARGVSARKSVLLPRHWQRATAGASSSAS